MQSIYPIETTNDDLAAFFAEKRKNEVYASSTELEIILREREILRYFNWI
ncbi:MAG TPA: hypothetical protein VKC60_09935 [Opitutaceae bacterium]|nr:hypothetical protein [Opitutaceae bacterium]